MIFVLALMVVAAQAATHHPHSHPTHDPAHTHIPHHTHSHEHNEHGTSTFYFDAKTHHMVMRLDSKCYLMKLDDTEATKVHDAAGIVEIELAMVKLIGAANETMVAHDALAIMSAHIAHMCPNGAMQLERI
ncbi:uncharacterized protein LOC128185142 [Crassostrea angulata]|uniref:uncharacterized protein LOC128185142 n=1 Tax=Magallana angulata TaxID=2784310 RepID=UPI0022B1436D|nr:uncharacterized protein LOC128185142 [Crassostrea angulata]XP_052710785.1 uncharacterized protein LOC128185142 [Crassostrea angulata]